MTPGKRVAGQSEPELVTFASEAGQCVPWTQRGRKTVVRFARRRIAERHRPYASETGRKREQLGNSTKRYGERIEQLQQVLRERRLAGALLFYSRDILYYTGTAQPAYFVVLPDDHRLFVRRGYAFACSECALDSERVVAESSIAKICAQMFPGAGAGEKVGSELDLLSVAQAGGVQRALNQRELVDISADILRQRMIKDEAEVDSVAKACSAVHAGHLALIAGARAGMSELELAALIENAQRLAGHEGAYFMRGLDSGMGRGPLASGPNLRRTSGVAYTITGTGMSSAVPGGPSRRRVERGDLLVVDIPACIEGYHADQSRSYALEAFPAGAVDLFARLRAVSDRVIAGISCGMKTGEVYALAEDHANHLGLGSAFLGFEAQPRAHFVGHGVGLEINEPPLLVRNGQEVLEAGMVLAIEMHVMQAGGHTVKIEDTVHLTPTGIEMLSLSARELSLAGAACA